MKMIRPLAFCFMLILKAVAVYAQTSSPVRQADSLFLEKDDSLIVLKLSFNNEYESFTQQTENNFFDIRPNVAWMSKLSVSYRFISAAVSFKLPFIPGNEDNDKKGTTKKLNFSFGFSSGRWTQDLYLGKVKGFYLHNTADVIQDWDPDDPYFLLPGLTVYRAGGSTTFQLNRNYSFKAISTQTQRQLKSCGSPMFTALYDFYRIDNEGPQGTGQYQRSDNFEGLLSAGYYYTFVLKSHWYAGLGSMAGYGFVRSNVELYQTASVVPEESTYSNPLFQYRLQAGLGYNAGRVVAGADFTWSDATRKEADSPVRTDMHQFFLHFFVGYKFGAPGILRKSTDKAADIIPLLK